MKNRNHLITKNQFINDIEVLFEELKNSYGAYDYFGEKSFMNAKQAILNRVDKKYDFEENIEFLRNEFRKFIYDGHFSIDNKSVMEKPKRSTKKTFDYAIKTYRKEGIPVFDIKKFTYSNEKEKIELENFAKSGAQYKDEPCLIFDLRQNGGGSDVYIWEFLKSMNNEEPDIPVKFMQKYSDTFIEWLNVKHGVNNIEPGVQTIESNGKTINKNQTIYVLIDGTVASSGESAVAYLKTMSGTTLLGENTRGCYFCGSCIDIYLPNSGVNVYYGTGILLYDGKNIDELGGFTPDIPGVFEIEDVIQLWRDNEQRGNV